jgi:uncharacterized protein (TIGR03086 family)
MSDTVISRFDSLVRGFDARVQATPADRWDSPAPCEGWTAADVVEHVTNNLTHITAQLCGTEQPAFDRSDPVGSWNAGRTGALEAVRTSDLSREVPSPMGPMSVENMIGRLICNDVLVHTWDLARAVGGDERLDPDAVAGGYAGLKPLDAMIRRPGVFGPKIDPAEGDDLQTEFLKFLGRPV